MPRLHRVLLLVPTALLAAAPATALAAVQVQVKSDSLLRLFQQERPDGSEKTGLPGYEYLQVDVGALDSDGLSFHGYAWGRHDFGDYYEDRSTGEILYGYAQYARAEGNVSVRLGRQYVFEGIANDSLDGARLGADLTPYFTVSAYGGQPVALEETDGRAGDALWGGRVAHHWGSLYEVGVSYKRARNDGDLEAEFLGIDSSLILPAAVSFHGLSKRNLVDDAWAEHSYEARVTVWKATLRPFFQAFDYDAYFGTGKETANPFANPTGGATPLQDSGEKVKILGGDLSLAPTESLEVGLKAKHYDYDERSDTAWYYAGLLTLRGKGLSSAGLEGGVMDGGDSPDKYLLGRGFFYWDGPAAFLSGDLVYVKYDEDINGYGRSLFASVGGGVKLLSDALQVKLSGDYSKDPYFDKDVRGMLSVAYTYGKL